MTAEQENIFLRATLHAALRVCDDLLERLDLAGEQIRTLERALNEELLKNSL